MPETTKPVVAIGLGDVSLFRGDEGRIPPTEPTPQTSDASEPSEAVRNFRVALVTMPFAPCWTGSIQIGLLKAIAEKAGFVAHDFYPNVDLAAILGAEVYRCICFFDETYQLTGEWLFSIAAFGEEASREEYFAACPEEATRIASQVGKDVAFLNDLRERVIPEYIDACLDKFDWGSYNAVGFTSTFQQHVASLALAQRIKAKYPQVKIIFGGSNMDDEMGIEHVRSFPCIDYAVIGEGDVVFPELLRRLAEGRDTDDLRGVASRRGDEVSFPGASPLVRDLESLPTADYSTYFNLVRSLDIEKDFASANLTLDLPVEGSRGCWWGAKQHCTFCNLNDNVMAYRGRSADRLLRELDELYAKYGVNLFWATDSIMDWRIIGPLLTRFAEEPRGYQFSFFNLKANMTREQIRILQKGGLQCMQAGIESLSTRVLKLMRKGCTKLQNLTCLKWCKYYGVECGWNLLHGFPGERVEDYADQLATLRHITHFRPPNHRMKVTHVQFSPLFYDDEQFPKKWRHPATCYSCIYPERVNLEKVASYFECELYDVLPEETHDETNDFVDRWVGLWALTEPSLTYRRAEGDIRIDDTRYGPNRHRSYTLVGPDADIYEAFGSAPRTPAQACAALSSDCPGQQPDEEAVTAACNAFCDAGLMIGELGKYLSLALPADPEF